MPIRAPTGACNRLDGYIHPDLIPQSCSRQGLDCLCLCGREEPCRAPKVLKGSLVTETMGFLTLLATPPSRG